MAGKSYAAAGKVKCQLQMQAGHDGHSSILPRDQVQELTYAFHKFDVNKTGKVTASELGKVLRCLGLDTTEEELEQMVREFDMDGDGCINLDEFIRLNEMTSEMESSTPGRENVLEAVFRMFDRDANGYICPAELQTIFNSLGDKAVTQEECRRMIQGADMDGDGQVDFREFEALMFAP